VLQILTEIYWDHCVFGGRPVLYGWWEKCSKKGKSQSNRGIVAVDPCGMGEGRTKLCTMGKHNNPGSANLGRSAGRIMRRRWSDCILW
jgi:hypothetical protein